MRGTAALCIALALLAAAAPALAQEERVSIASKEQGCSDERQFCFDRDTLKVTGGQEVVIEFRNEGNTPHSLCVEDLPGGEVCSPEPETGSAPGSREELRFMAPAEGGTFSYYCKVPGHRELGMEGELNVTAAGEENATRPTGDEGERRAPGLPIAAGVAALALLALAARRRT